MVLLKKVKALYLFIGAIVAFWNMLVLLKRFNQQQQTSDQGQGSCSFGPS